jgi:lipoate-protein ligase A
MGNLVFSFLLPHNPLLDFKSINNTILGNTFKTLGIDAQFNSRSDILIEGKKVRDVKLTQISGCAFKIYLQNSRFNAKSVHHGTLLLNSNLDHLYKYLNSNSTNIVSKGVDSIKSKVTNLNDKYPTLTKEAIYNALQSEFLKHHNLKNKEVHVIDEQLLVDNEKIKELYDNYMTWEWTFGNSPEFSNTFSQTFKWGSVELFVKVEHGMIVEAKLDSLELGIYVLEMNDILYKNKGRFRYNSTGIECLMGCLLEEDFGEYTQAIYEMKNAFISQI